MADNIIEPVRNSPLQQNPTPTRRINPVFPLLLANVSVTSSLRSSADRSNEGPNTSSPVVAISQLVPVRSLFNPACCEHEYQAKRRKTNTTSTGDVIDPSSTTTEEPLRQEKLESRLGSILCCAVCLDLPKTSMFQCQMGHLMCDPCFAHLLADARIRDQVATCPNCRTEISRNTAIRNLAVEKAALELPKECQYCNHEYPSKSIEYHEQHDCKERPTVCKYFRIGCQWKGPNHEVLEHEANCLHPKKTGLELMPAVESYQTKLMEERNALSSLVDLLCYEKIIFNDLQMKLYKTDEYVPRLFYETFRFSAFNHQFIIKGKINKSQRDLHQCTHRQITYQLILRSKTSVPLNIHYFALKGPLSETKVNTKIYNHVFTDENNETDFLLLPVPNTAECNRLLASTSINFRLLMFLVTN